jgi:isocitrate dehydrogenase kinase/phosphatase
MPPAAFPPQPLPEVPPQPAPASQALEQAYARLSAAANDADCIDATARLILAIFDAFYAQISEYPLRAQRAFEAMDPHAAIEVSRERLQLYSRTIAEHGPRILEAYPALAADAAGLWSAIDAAFTAMIVDRYEADIAFSFAHSMRRNICHELWRPVAYSFPPPSERRAFSRAAVYRRLAVQGRVDAPLLVEALQAPRFAVPFRDLAGDVRRILARLEQQFTGAPERMHPRALDVVEAGFFRDRHAFLVARWLLPDGSYAPFVVAFLNSPQGVYADALLHRTADVHNLFSSTLANMHVTTRLYYQTCVFLHSLMPMRPLGQQYSTIGYNHVGKVAILDEIVRQMRASGQRFSRSPGVPGTVALGFTFDACSYHLKVIRDRPTGSYKWGAYPGPAAVLEKYRVVHEINRAGSMLDNVMYFNLRLDPDLFEPALLDEILALAAGTVHRDEGGVFVRSLIVQLKIVPLPVYLEAASPAAIEAVITSLGHCIRDNAATNIFNKDLDSRNYGVGRYGRVFLFDYDAVEPLTGVKIRTNADREPGEDTPPPWFFEDGVIFLPEELELGMNLKSDAARRCFRRINAELMTVRYWQDVQDKLLRGDVPELVTVPPECRLAH